jgi:hypothetical protein
MTACFCFLWEKGKKKKKSAAPKKKRESIDSKPICVSEVRDGGGKKTFTFLFQRPQQPHWQGIVNPSLPFAQQTKVVQTSDFSSFTTASKATHTNTVWKRSRHEATTTTTTTTTDVENSKQTKERNPGLKKTKIGENLIALHSKKKWIKKYGNTSATGAYRWPKDNEERKRKNQIKKQRTEACRCKQSLRDAKRKGSQKSWAICRRDKESEKDAGKFPIHTAQLFFIQENISHPWML